jgi:hypothetical protein
MLKLRSEGTFFQLIIIPQRPTYPVHYLMMLLWTRRNEHFWRIIKWLVCFTRTVSIIFYKGIPLRFLTYFAVEWGERYGVYTSRGLRINLLFDVSEREKVAILFFISYYARILPCVSQPKILLCSTSTPSHPLYKKSHISLHATAL